MEELPSPLADFICRLAVAANPPAYLRADADGVLEEAGGALDLFGLAGLVRGEPADAQVEFLLGLVPAQGPPLHMPAIETPSGRHADVHVFGDGASTWVLLLDRTAEVEERRVAQQLSNDMTLLRESRAQSVERQLGAPGGTGALRELLSFALDGECKDASILIARLRGLTAYSQSEPTDVVFETVNLYARAIFRPVYDEGGMADWIVGDAVRAVFGIVPSSGSTGYLATTAALRMMEAVAEVSASRRREGKAAFDLAVGIASGQVAFGLLGGKDRKTLGAIGPSVEMAALLERAARGNEVLVDETTHARLESLQRHFTETRTPSERGGADLRTFSHATR